MKRHSGSKRRSRFLQPAEERQGAGEVILPCVMISIGFNGASKTRYRLVVVAEIKLRDAGDKQPSIEIIVPGTEPDRLLDVGLGFLEATDNNLRETDGCVSVGKVRIQRQRAFTFGESPCAAWLV